MKKLKTTILLMCLVFLMACSTTSTGVTFETEGLTIQTATQTISLTVEVADSAEKRAQGLMNRASLDDGAGMLFVFDESSDHSFWMKDTNISLDMIFINDSKEIVYIEEETTPLSETPITAGQNSRYLLEVNAGFAEENNVNIGDVVSF
ncbi:MAG: DUF192 domain-containing protein [bacterium]